jgi:PAS domain-containing protein
LTREEAALPQAATTSAATPRPARQRWRIRTYIVFLAAPVLLVQVGSALFERSRTIEDAEATAEHNASHVAHITATLIGVGVEDTRADVEARAASAVSPLDTGCTSTVSGAGPAAGGHIDVIGADGVTHCTSASAGGTPIADVPPPWLAQVLAGPAVIAPVTDPTTGHPVAVFGAPFADGSGAVVRTVDLIAYSAELAPLLGSGEEFEVLITDGAHVVVSTLEPERWIGAPIAGTGFTATNGASSWRDLDGTQRVFGRSTVSSTGWTVYVGSDRDHAIALAEHSADRNLLIGTALLLLVLFAVVVVFRQIVNPISRLSGRVRDALASGTSQPLVASGPREVEELAADFRELVTDRERELADVRRLAATNAAILDSAIDSVVTIDSDGNIVEFNPAAERTFGYTRAEVLGEPMAEIIIPERLRGGLRAGLLR